MPERPPAGGERSAALGVRRLERRSGSVEIAGKTQAVFLGPRVRAGSGESWEGLLHLAFEHLFVFLSEKISE